MSIFAFAKNSHIISTTIEHPSVIQSLNKLEKQGYKVSFLPVDKTGTFKIENLINEITPNTGLIVLSYANSETGVKVDIKKRLCNCQGK